MGKMVQWVKVTTLVHSLDPTVEEPTLGYMEMRAHTPNNSKEKSTVAMLCCF